MNDEMTQYTKDLRLTPTMVERINELYVELLLLTDIKFSDLFLEEDINNNERPKYIHLTFFGDGHIAEYFNFMTNYSLRIISIIEKIGSLAVQKTNFDYVNATDESSITISWLDNFGSGGKYYATGLNSLQILQIYKKHFMPAYLSQFATGKKNTASPIST